VILKEPIPFYIDDVVQLRKPHPCGSYEWSVVRIGADIGLRCLICGRRVLLPRRTLEKRLKKFISRGPTAPEFVESDGDDLAHSNSHVLPE
jgi:hypothetical protein